MVNSVIMWGADFYGLPEAINTGVTGFSPAETSGDNTVATRYF